MRAMRDLIKNRHGTYYAQRKVPERLQREVAVVLNHPTERKPFLKKSLGTKVLSQANITAKPVLMEFDRILRAAEALKNAKPPTRESLSSAEISRMSEYIFAKELEWDERWRVGGRDEWKRSERELRKILKKEDRELGPLAYRYEDLPPHGFSIAQLNDNREQLVDDLRAMREALALGNVSVVEDHVADALDTFAINLDPSSLSRPQLGIAVLRAYVRALQAIEKRNDGEAVETPTFTHDPLSAPAASGGTLRDATKGWEKERARPATTIHEYKRAVDMFIQLHGDLPVSEIKRSHALRFREALQIVPQRRVGALRTATLPELSEWGRRNSSVTKVSAGTVNKQLGAVQAIAAWAHEHGVIPEDATWADPFTKMRVQEEQSERTSFESAELKLLFAAPVFTKHEYPQGGRGVAAFWLPLLALFTGARQAELAGLTAANIQLEAETSTPLLYVTAQASRGKRLKTASSQRVIPIHTQLVKLGFLRFVNDVRQRGGANTWLFPKCPGSAPVRQN